MRYHGGKWLLALRIIPHLPPHRVYVEPYGGAASVLLRKPRVYAEVYNDRDGEVCNVFRVLRNTGQASELERLLRLTPFALEEFRAAYEPAEDPVEQARRTIVRSFMGFGSAAAWSGYNTGFRGKSFRSGVSPAADWRNYPDCLKHFTDRLQGVAIHNLPALEIVATHDREDVLFFVDPPYVHATRYRSHDKRPCYKHEMTDQAHEALAAALHRVEGLVVLCGYQSALYGRLFEDWQRVELDAYADGARPRKEVLWFNPAAVVAKEKVRPSLMAAGVATEEEAS
jgi:DNA adenine methylase